MGKPFGTRRRAAPPLIVVVALLAVAAPANAAPATIGQLGPSNPPVICTGGPADFFNSAVSSGSSYVVPPGYTRITSWSTNAGAGAGQTLKLKVFRLVSGTTYLVVAHDGPRSLTPSTLNTFTVNIPVQPGDFVGLNDQNAPSAHSACVYSTGNLVDTYVQTGIGDGADGTTETINGTTSGYRANLSVTLAAQPVVTSVAPSSGATSGGTSVTITGHDFTGATAVSFGGVAAPSFTVKSDTSVTAVAPAGAAGSVDVTVTTPAGQSALSAADRFMYVAPAVTSVAPAKGPRTGGTSVTITGQNFTGATAVSFGGVPAKSFTVESDASIAAVAPAAAAGSVDVTVTTPFGRSTTSTADRFTFEQVCVVPKLTGKTLKAAKKALRKAHCGLGKVTGPKTGKVRHQSRKRGKSLPAGTKVNVTLA